VLAKVPERLRPAADERLELRYNSGFRGVEKRTKAFLRSALKAKCSCPLFDPLLVFLQTYPQT
jgi:hypothetical protein